jgi:ATP phosphoribosyltransferase
MDYVKIALPKGKLLEQTACFLDEIGLGFKNYSKETRLYHLEPKTRMNLSSKIFQERDIPNQVAIGNYDIGICGLDWVEELVSRYPESPVIKMANLEYAKSYLYLATSKYSRANELKRLVKNPVTLRIVSEYPNLSEVCALNLRLKKFKIFPVYGAAEAYPPENADLVIIKTEDVQQIKDRDLIPLKMLLQSNATLILNKKSWQTKNMVDVMNLLSKGLKMKKKPWIQKERNGSIFEDGGYYHEEKDTIRVALPDGHQLSPTADFLNKCGLKLEGYTSSGTKHRPVSNLEWLKTKVIRPQDMPMQVANDNFDLAITGKDWLYDHIYRFPSSPIKKLLDFDFGAVNIVAAVNRDLRINNISGIKSLMDKGSYFPLKVASEYTNIAEYYLHNNHIKRYRMIPTSGASETLLPDDADLLIDNTETGKTIAAHNLQIIDTLFRSSACLIANRNSMKSTYKKSRLDFLINKFKKGSSDKK